MKVSFDMHHVLIAAITVVLIFLACPLFIASQNPAEISAFPLAGLVKNGLFLSAIFFAAYLSILLLAKKIPFISSIAVFVLSFVFLTTYILPLSIAPGMIEPEEHGINAANLAIGILLSAGVAVASAFRQSVFKFAIVAVLAMSTVNFAFSILNIRSALAANGSDRSGEFTHISKERSILVISFDGLPGDIVSDVLNESASYSTAFKDFTYFPNTYSQSPATRASSIGAIFGTQDFKAFGESAEQVLETLKDSPLHTNLYFTKVDDFKHSHSALDFFPRTSPFEKNEQHTAGFILDSGFSRIFTRHIFSTGFPWIVDKISISGSAPNALDPDRHHGAKWDFQSLTQINHWHKFFTSFTVAEDIDFSVRYVHFTLTHFPVDLDKNCAYRSDSKEWFEANQNYDGIKNETICALDKAATFVKQLKKIGAYENATIVFKSDHGKPQDFYDSAPHALTFNDHARWGYDRYRPFVMIKAASTSGSSLKFDERMVFLNDLAKTLCLDSKIENIDCDLYNGLDLLSDDPAPDEPYFIYVVKDEDSSYTFDTHLSVKVPNRNVDLLEHLKKLDAVAVSEN